MASDKLKEAIVYIGSILPSDKITKVKLHKILFFADYDFFAKHFDSITDAYYVKLPMGPCIDDLANTLNEMSNDSIKLISIPMKEGYRDQETFEVLREPNLAIFSKEELDLLTKYAEFFRDKSSSFASEFSHKRIPGWNSIENNDQVPLALAYYENDDDEFIVDNEDIEDEVVDDEQFIEEIRSLVSRGFQS